MKFTTITAAALAATLALPVQAQDTKVRDIAESW